MTQTGKCDTCRQRKVKCDEEKPVCGACRKKDRPCTYSYGKVSTLVVQDPKQLTKHGKSRTTPLIYSLNTSGGESTPDSSPSSDLHITTQRVAGDGHGFFQTLASASRAKVRLSKKKIDYQKRALEKHLQQLRNESAVISYQPSSPETTLIARYIGMLGFNLSGQQSFHILGTWIDSIPSRIGSNRVIDLAADFLVNSCDTFRDDTYSKQKIARASKAEALRELQLAVINTQGQPTYDVILATKMHYAAEVLIGISSMYHAIHAFGLAEWLKSGTVANVDDEHFWSLLDNTYVDDVNEALMTGRKSVYDNEFYLSATYPPPLDSGSVSLSASQRASMAIMHVFIQCPRTACLIRHASTARSDTSALASAMSQVEHLVQLNCAQHVTELIRTATTVVPIPPAAEVADIMPYSLDYDSVQSLILCTRFWMLQNVLCGFAATLYRHFPEETASSMLPSPEKLQAIDIDSSLQLAMSMRWVDTISQQLPLASLRLHTPLQLSLGPWRRIIRDLTIVESANSHLQAGTAAELSRAVRMRDWIIKQCNHIHIQWKVDYVDVEHTLEGLDCMFGEQMPDWLPVRVRFEAEDGEMVLKMDYENRTEHYGLSDSSAPRMKPSCPYEVAQDSTANTRELPIRVNNDRPEIETLYTSYSSTQKTPFPTPSGSSRPVDFLHSSGRGICATSGWWPRPPCTPNTATVRLGDTDEATTYSGRTSPSIPEVYESSSGMNRHASLASSWEAQTPDTSTVISSNTSNSTPISPASQTITVTLDNKKKNACLSPAWSSNY